MNNSMEVKQTVKITKAPKTVYDYKKKGYYYINENDVVVLCTKDEEKLVGQFNAVIIKSTTSSFYAEGGHGQYMSNAYKLFQGEITINQDI